ncbi:MAG: cytidylate kinase-like family protein [Clostridia bacterium]|nr:cytidylate kinase-like family protein [Clostridia bacterium]
MKNAIICIGRQYGSGGREIGETLAKRLGVTCYDKLLIKQAAKEGGFSEAVVAENDEQPIGLSEMVSGNPFADSVSLCETFYSEKQRVFEAESKAILEIASKGPCVIIGRCASSILRGAGYDVLSMFIYADRDDRAARIARRNGMDIKAAARKAEKVDRVRKKYFDFYSDTPWGEPSSYDLMISSSRYGIDGTADILANAVKDKV